MNRRLKRAVTALAVGGLSFTAAIAAQGSATAAAPSTAYGLKLLPPATTVSQLDDALYAALGEAERLTEKNPNDYGYAWADRSSGHVVIDVVTPHGRVAAAAAIAALAGPAAAHKPVLRATSKSRAALEQLKHDVIDLAPAGAFSSVDPETSEVALTVPVLTQSLATAITSRYGTDSVAVRVDSTIVVLTLQGGVIAS